MDCVILLVLNNRMIKVPKDGDTRFTLRNKQTSSGHPVLQPPALWS